MDSRRMNIWGVKILCDRNDLNGTLWTEAAYYLGFHSTMHSCQLVSTCLVQCFLASGHHEYIFKLFTVLYCRLQQSMPHRLAMGILIVLKVATLCFFIHSKTDLFTDKVVMAVFFLSFRCGWIHRTSTLSCDCPSWLRMQGSTSFTRLGPSILIETHCLPARPLN